MASKSSASKSSKLTSSTKAKPAAKKTVAAPAKKLVKTADTPGFDFDSPGLGVKEISAAIEAAKITADPVLNTAPASLVANKEEEGREKSSKSSLVEDARASQTRAQQEGGQTGKSSKLAQPVLRIFQIYYEAWQRELLDPNFVPLDNGKTSSELMEFAVFERLVKSDYVKDAQLWGALSWRFTERTGMSGADWMKAIVAQPGKDIYFCDPVPVNEALFHNFWLQGETSHPQFLALCQAIFKVTGLPESELTGLQSSDQFSASNYFVGTSRFWQTYIPWVNQVLSAANKKLPPKVRDLMHSKMADDRDLHKGATYVPFIVERLLPVFLKTAGKGLSAHKIALPKRDAELNVHLKLLREMKDVAHRTKSAWLAACWVNYRNLYLMQVNGKEWCDKHLRNITPTEITFS